MSTNIARKIVGFKVLSNGDQEAEVAAQAAAEASATPAVDYDPTGEVLPGAPMGVHDAKRFGAEYVHPLNGKQSLFIVAGYAPAKGLSGGEEVVADRWFEMFMPAGQREDIQPWVSVTMKLATLCLQQGVPLSRVLKRFDCPGSLNIPFPVPGGKKQIFTSEVQVVGQAFKNLAIAHGLLDNEGRDIPFFKRAVPASAKAAPAAPVEVVEDTDDAPNAPADASKDGDGYPAHAVSCARCRMKAMVPRDGCLTCLNCGDSKCG